MRPYNEAHHHCQPNQLLLESSNTLNNCDICMDLSHRLLRDASIFILQTHPSPCNFGKVCESPQLLTYLHKCGILYVWVSFGYKIDESYFPTSPTIILVWEKM
jgi:hypothetical protein